MNDTCYASDATSFPVPNGATGSVTCLNVAAAAAATLFTNVNKYAVRGIQIASQSASGMRFCAKWYYYYY